MSVDRSRPNPNRGFRGHPPQWAIVVILTAVAGVTGLVCGVALHSVEVGFTAAAIVLAILRDIVPH